MYIQIYIPVHSSPVSLSLEHYIPPPPHTGLRGGDIMAIPRARNLPSEKRLLPFRAKEWASAGHTAH